MSGFTDAALEKKLAELNCSQQSIQTLSLWLIHHRKHHKTIVQVWYRELLKAKPSRKLTMMYLANDVIQNSKKKGPEFSREFLSVLCKAFHNVTDVPDEKTQIGVKKILKVWEDRNVYNNNDIEEFRKATQHHTEQIWTTEIEPPVKKIKPIPEEKDQVHSLPPGDPPDPEELIKALQDLENAASSDAVVREKIANLPPEVSDVSLLEKLDDKEAADKLSKQVDEACSLLDDYNSRLQQELEDRKQVAKMLNDYTYAQRNALALAEQKLEEYREKLQKVTRVQNELKSHLQNLPDLTLLPNVTGGLAPLPSAGDLFSHH
ncbi:regulation of nuclear pre-mRNA domain-containing protein 1B-like isoform X2 [Limulus polyphemus]|uniref:Regulation of nuclear pre-mRNA domain-containing protein 1B-like isoform X2 n=1 Tax=Limulus polyphemus TaxID=6850 RepID=A0ABM1BXQ8_LIMPO|nr:regulation of nuclear pre-mRNA domain-containing protein 1B-like isoform X2 [Limulus polyphemus]